MFLQSREHLDLLFSVTVARILICNTDCVQSCRLLRVVPRPHPHQSSSTYRALWCCNTFWHIIHLSLKISFYYSHHLTEEETKHQRGYVTRLVSHSQSWDLNPNHSVEKLEWVLKFCPPPRPHSSTVFQNVALGSSHISPPWGACKNAASLVSIPLSESESLRVENVMPHIFLMDNKIWKARLPRFIFEIGGGAIHFWYMPTSLNN